MSDQQPNIPSQSAKPAAKKANNSGKKSLFIFLGLIVLGAVGFALYRVEMMLLNQSALEQQLKSLTQQTQQQAIESGKQQAQYEQTEKALTEMTGQLAFMQHTLNQIPGARLDDWKLAETEYLLRLANQRVYLQNELKAAQGLFDAANQVLASLDDPALLVVREQIAKEMLLLGQHSQLDRQGIYTQLQAIKGLVHDSIQPPSQFTQTPIQDTESTETEQSLLQQILSLVSIRHRDEAFNAPLTDSQYQLLEHNLNLMLEQAQWALLKGDNTLYQSSLQNALNWVNSNIRHSNGATLSNKLNELLNINVETTTPDVSESLRMLRQLVKDRTYTPSPIKPAQKKENPTPSDDTSEKNPSDSNKSSNPPTLKEAPQLNSQTQEQV